MSTPLTTTTTSLDDVDVAIPSQRDTIIRELWSSLDLIFQSKLTWLLALGPIALFGDATGILPAALCFSGAGLALIPCAERLSFVTEQVAEHTNGTIGALLNATFGNAPELLISTAALRSGVYRVLQLAMLGSMLTNLLFVFGLSCLVGGLRWQVQELRITSGNVSVGMLLLATAGSLLPAALVLGGQLPPRDENDDPDLPSKEELQFSRVNAVIMITLYICYLFFQLGTHKEEFDEEDNIVEANGHMVLLSPSFSSRQQKRPHARRNLFCLRLFSDRETIPLDDRNGDIRSEVELANRPSRYAEVPDDYDDEDEEEGSASTTRNEDVYPTDDLIFVSKESQSLPDTDDFGGRNHQATMMKRKVNLSYDDKASLDDSPVLQRKRKGRKSHDSDAEGPLSEDMLWNDRHAAPGHNEVQMSLRAGILWLFIFTLCISAMSDILVDTIRGFADSMHISEVFTSVVILPFFSNVAEQVSAVIFAYRNEMDLCVGVTVGSAIQITSFVMPGCVLFGMLLNHSLTLYFRAYETASLFFGVVVVAAVLQGGTTNWLVGATLIGIYLMVASGFWFHELELSSDDDELLGGNETMPS